MGVPNGYTSAQVVQAVPTVINSALVLISSTTIGSAVSSVTVSNAFSATYDNYLITVNGGAGSADLDLRLTLGATATGYAMNIIYTDYNNTVAAAGSTNQTSFKYSGAGNTTTLMASLTLQNPFLTEFTYVFGNQTSALANGFVGGFLNNTTSYTAFTITPSTGTLTGGTIRVYGYTNS